jgi:translation elongation factor EF-Ts
MLPVGVPVAKVKQALVEAKNDYQQALVRLDKEALAAGQKKQAKLSTRSAKEGVICLVQRQGVGSVMLEVQSDVFLLL